MESRLSMLGSLLAALVCCQPYGVLLPVEPGQDSQLGSATRAAREAIAALDFDGADRAIDALERKSPELKASTASLREESRVARTAWTQITSALSDAIAGKKAISLSFSPTRLNPGRTASKPHQVLAVDGVAMRVQAQGARSPETRSVLAVEPGVLLGLASRAQPANDELKIGVAWLALLQRGPDAARRFILDAGLPAAARKPMEDACIACADLWLNARLAGASKRAAELGGASPPPPPDIWSFVADDAAELMTAWKTRPDYARVRPALRKLFTESREESFRVLPVEALFRAKESKLERGVIELLYDFSTKEQADDFLPVKGVETRTEWVKAQRTLKLTGEVRLLDAEPFRGSLSVSGKASAYDAASPNVNLALWTSQAETATARQDQVWKRLDAIGKASPSPEGGGGSVTLGMGFRLDLGLEKLGDERTKSMIRGLKGFLPLYLREPSLVILVAASGQAPGTASSSVAWESTAAGALKGPFQFAGSMDARGKLLWSINRRALKFEESPGVKRFASDPQRSGSISFFTNGSTVQLTSIKIVAELNPDWQADHARTAAATELRKLDGELSEKKPAGNGSKK